MKRSVKFPLLLLALAVFPVFSLPAFAERKHQALYEEAFKLYRQLDSNSGKAKNPETWDLIGRTFYRIYRENPKGENAPISLFIAAKVHETKDRRFRSPEDGEKALRYSLELVRRYPKSSLADDSQFRAGRILERRGEKTRAYVAYRKIVRDMPKGDMYPRARKKLELLAKHKPKPAAKKSAAAKKPKPAPPEKTAKKDAAAPAPAGFATVKKIRHWSTDTDDYTRVVIETDREVDYASKLLGADPDIKAPPRLYVDLEKTVIDDSVNIEPITKGLLEKIKFHPNRPGVARVVLYIKDFESHKVFSLPKSKHHPFFRVVMDIKGSGARPEKIFAKDPPGDPPRRRLSLPRRERRFRSRRFSSLRPEERISSPPGRRARRTCRRKPRRRGLRGEPHSSAPSPESFSHCETYSPRCSLPAEADSLRTMSRSRFRSRS